MSPPSPKTQDFDLLEFAAILWRRKIIMIAMVVAFLAAAVIYLNFVTYTYTAELQVTAAQSTQPSGSKLGALGGLASIAGLSLPQDGSATSFQLYTEGVNSRGVAERLAARNDLMRVVFGGEWNVSRGKFEAPHGSFPRAAKGIKMLLGLPVYDWRPPDAARLQEYLDKQIKVSQTPKSPVVTIAYSNADPVFAERFLTALHVVLDDNLRQKALIRSTRYIDYLSQQLSRVTLAEHRSVLAQALSEQERTRMMATSSLPFAADPLGPVVSSLRPTNPKPLNILGGAIALGVFFGVVVAFFTEQFYERRSSTARTNLESDQ